MRCDGREHRIAAVALLVVAVVLVAVDDDLVADLPALHLRADRPDDAGRVRAGDVIGVLVPVERGDRLAERGPDAVVVDAGRHHEDEHVVAVELPGGHDLDLHGRDRARRAVPCGWPRRTCSWARGRAAESRRSRRDPSSRRWPVRPWQLPSWRRFGSSFLAPVMDCRTRWPARIGWRHHGRTYLDGVSSTFPRCNEEAVVPLYDHVNGPLIRPVLKDPDDFL